MPYTSMPAWPTPDRPGSVGSRALPDDLFPRLREARERPQARGAPERAESDEGVHRAREEALRRDRLRQVPRHARPGRRAFGANARRRLGQSDTPGGPHAELDLPRRLDPRGYLPVDEHGAQRHAHAGVRRRRPEARAESGRSRTSSTRSRGAAAPGYSNLVVAKHVQDPIDLAKGAANFASAPAARFPIVGQIMEPGRSFHPPATSVIVQAIYDAESIAFLVRWHDMSAEKTGKNGPSLPVPIEEEEERRPAAGGARCRRVAPTSLRRPGRGQPLPSRPPIRLPSRRRRPRRYRSSPTPSRSRFRRRCRRARGSPTSSSATVRTRSISGSSIWRAPDPLQFTGKGSADIAPNDTGRSDRCRELRPG